MQVDTAEAVAVDTLAARDEIVLVTDHSTYRFVVECPDEGRGSLRGGRMPDVRRAFLCGVVDRPNAFRPATLKRGTRALFLIEEEDGQRAFRRILTSSLLDVRVVRHQG
jgi:hypothetical protein